MLLIIIGGVLLGGLLFLLPSIFMSKETRCGYSGSCTVIFLALTICFGFLSNDEVGFYKVLGMVAFLPNFVINAIIFAYSIEEKYGNVVLILFVIIAPFGIKAEGIISKYRFDKFCEKNYEYKIYKKLELPRKYFHEATTQEIAKSNGKLKAGDLVPNMEYIA